MARYAGDVMPDFRIYYDGSQTYDGDPYNAPAWGVLAIVEKDPDNGRRLITTKDYFVWLGDRWMSVDYIGMLDYLGQPGKKKVVFGRMVDDAYFASIMKIANEDPDFPVRTGWGCFEMRL